MQLTPMQARKKLRAAIDKAGNAKRYAERLGVSDVLISDMRHGRRYISGVVADDLGLARVTRVIVSYQEVA